MTNPITVLPKLCCFQRMRKSYIINSNRGVVIGHSTVQKTVLSKLFFLFWGFTFLLQFSALTRSLASRKSCSASTRFRSRQTRAVKKEQRKGTAQNVNPIKQGKNHWKEKQT